MVCPRESAVFSGSLPDVLLAFSRATSRILPHPDGSTKVVNFVLTQSRVSAQKRRRILNFAHTNADFLSLNHACWDDIELRKSMVIAASSLDVLEEDHIFGQDVNLLDDYEACWAVLQAAYMHPVYLTPTRYNFFRLIRLGNIFSAEDKVSLSRKHNVNQSLTFLVIMGDFPPSKTSPSPVC